MAYKVLWVEDGARLELRSLCAPILTNGKIDFNLADDVTMAAKFMSKVEFDVVIVDVRLPPGTDPFWLELYEKSGSDRVHAELGIWLLRWMLGESVGWQIQPKAPISPKNIAVFTVESREEIRAWLDKLQIEVFAHKTAGLKDTFLLELIQKVLAQQGKSI